jgi:subtilase family serine protease
VRRLRGRQLSAAAVSLAAAAGALAGCTTQSGQTGVQATKPRRPPPTAYQLPAGVVHPFPFERELLPVAFPTRPTTAQCEALSGIACYSPHQLQVAYDLGPLLAKGDDGRGETIVIVDCFGSPTIAHDLATFDGAFGLPAPPSFKIATPAGALPPWDDSAAGPMLPWGVETSLDVEMAHAMAPGANIVLVETPVAETEGTAGFPQIVAAEKWAIGKEDPAVISQSFGATEGTFPAPSSILRLRTAFQLAANRDVTVLASAGDGGSTEPSNVQGTQLYASPVVDWPASDPLVTAIGGTQLHLSAKGSRLFPDNVWNDSNLTGTATAGGGGLSKIFKRPFFQAKVAQVTGDSRGLPDISLSAAEDGGAIVYESFPGTRPGYYVIGGTSEASPLFAGIVAIADQVAGRHLGLLNASLYAIAQEHRPGIVDITTGSNTVTFSQDGRSVTVTGYAAVPGYDLASGLGTVDAAQLVQELAKGP